MRNTIACVSGGIISLKYVFVFSFRKKKNIKRPTRVIGKLYMCACLYSFDWNIGQVTSDLHAVVSFEIKCNWRVRKVFDPSAHS